MGPLRFYFPPLLWASFQAHQYSRLFALEVWTAFLCVPDFSSLPLVCAINASLQRLLFLSRHISQDLGDGLLLSSLPSC